jgi:hypothetical protein
MEMYLFPKCLKNEYGCNDGGCIPIEKRCDEMSNCDDSSDENNCKTIRFDEDRYRKEKPPVQCSGKQTPVSKSLTSILVDISILSLGSFEELGMTFKSRVVVVLTWFDDRLEFVNLKAAKARGNGIGKDEGDKVGNRPSKQS